MARNLQSRSFTRKRHARLYWILALAAVSVISWVCALSFLTRLNVFAITQVQVFGADADITPALQLAAQRVLAGDYLGLFSRSSTLVYPKSAIAGAVKAASPRVLSANVSRDGLHGLIVTVSEKIPTAVVCAALPDFSDNAVVFDQSSGCYFADASGLLFEAAPAFSSSPDKSSVTVSSVPAYPVYYVPDLAIAGSSDAPVGSYATSTVEFSALQSFYEGAAAVGIPVEAILIKEGGEYELYASTTVIYFNDVQPLSDELSDLTAFWSNMKGASFDYIDLRYGSNVFYKALK